VSKLSDTIRSAIPYLHDAEVREAVEEALRSHADDAEEVEFENSDETLLRLSDVEAAMNEFDERVATQRAAAREAAKVAKEDAEKDE
jgi:hypothetical protein